MKWLLLLFSLYVVILSGIPCDCQEDNFMCTTGEATSGHHQHETDHQKQDCPCSPFFACSTCHGIVLPEATIWTTKPVYTTKQSVFRPFKENAISQSRLPIFQPPRLL